MPRKAKPKSGAKAPKTVKPKGQAAAPAAPAAPPRKTPSNKASKGPATVAPTTGVVAYIRNLHQAAGGSRIDLQLIDARLHLEPRGQRGDLRPVTEEMRQDPVYQHNLGLLFEEVAIDRAQEIIRKQSINQNTGPSTMDILTNEFGEKYTQTRASIMPSNEEQAVTVAHINPAGAGKNTERNVSIDTVRQAQTVDFFGGRERSLAPEEVNVPGSRPVFDPDSLPQWLNPEQAVEFVQTPREERQTLVEHWIRELENGETPELNVSYGEVNEEE